jgi:hypothetical protein
VRHIWVASEGTDDAGDYDGSGSSFTKGFGSLLHRSSFVDSRNTGNDQPNLIARLRTLKVTPNPAIIAGSLPAPNAVPATYVQAPSTDAVT